METKSMHTKLKKKRVFKILAATNLLFTVMLLLSPFFAIWSTWTITIKVCISALLGASISRFLYKELKEALKNKQSSETNFSKRLLDAQEEANKKRQAAKGESDD